MERATRRLLLTTLGAATLLWAIPTGCAKDDAARAKGAPTPKAVEAAPDEAAAADQGADDHPKNDDGNDMDKFEGWTDLDGNWMFFATGTLEKVDKRNVDKTGRGKKFNIHIYLRHEKVERPEGEVTLPDVIMFNVTNAELEKLTRAELKEGDKVEVKATTHGRKPQSFRLRALKVL